MAQTNFRTDNNCSRDPMPSYVWRIVADSAATTENSTKMCDTTTQSLDDNNDSTEGLTYNFTRGDRVTTNKTTQDYTPTASTYDVTESRAILSYRKEDVALPISDYPSDKEHTNLSEYNTETSPSRIHRYKQITSHVNNNLQIRPEQRIGDRDWLPICIILAVSTFCAIIFGGIILIGRYNAHLYNENSAS